MEKYAREHVEIVAAAAVRDANLADCILVGHIASREGLYHDT